jgi:hypothetical protein
MKNQINGGITETLLAAGYGIKPTNNSTNQYPTMTEGQTFVKPTIGLPPGTTPTAFTPGSEITPTGAKPTTPGTTPGTNESFISKYKMPLIIGAVAIGYFFLRKK